MVDTAEVLKSVVSDDFLQTFEDQYNTELNQGNGEPSADTTFQYAWCLVRCRHKTDIKKGIHLLEQLLKNVGEGERRRDYLYYLAVGHGRNKDYNAGLKYLKHLLQLEPGNKQAQGLEKEMQKSMDSDALKGVAIAGGGLLAAGAIVGLGIALLKR